MGRASGDDPEPAAQLARSRVARDQRAAAVSAGEQRAGLQFVGDEAELVDQLGRVLERYLLIAEPGELRRFVDQLFDRRGTAT